MAKWWVADTTIFPPNTSACISLATVQFLSTIFFLSDVKFTRNKEHKSSVCHLMSFGKCVHLCNANPLSRSRTSTPPDKVPSHTFIFMYLFLTNACAHVTTTPIKIEKISISCESSFTSLQFILPHPVRTLGSQWCHLYRSGLVWPLTEFYRNKIIWWELFCDQLILPLTNLWKQISEWMPCCRVKYCFADLCFTCVCVSICVCVWLCGAKIGNAFLTVAYNQKKFKATVLDQSLVSLLLVFVTSLPLTFPDLMASTQGLVSPSYLCKFCSFPWVTVPTSSHSPSKWRTPIHPPDAHMVGPSLEHFLCLHGFLSELVSHCTLITWCLCPSADYKLPGAQGPRLCGP